jgi:diacylglycerol kinase family enzyme
MRRSVTPASMQTSMPLGELPLYIVFNPAAGSGSADEARRAIEQVLSDAGRRFEILPIDDPSRTADVAQCAVQAAAANGGAVVVAAGDGTTSAVAQAVLPVGCPFGIVPQGTFNYSSRAHGIPLDTAEAVRALLDPRLKPVQVGAVNDRIFVVNASLGLYPELLQDREQYKRQFGRKRVVALWAGIVTLSRRHPQLVLEIEHDRQREIVRTPTLFVGNNPLQLEQVGLPEAEDVRENRLAAVIVRPVSSARLLWLAVRGALGQLGDDENVRNFSFRSMMVRLLHDVGRRGVKVAVDGETVWLEPPLHFRVAPRPLLLMVPRAEQPGS